MNPVIVAVFYKDTTRPAQAGDEFIELVWEQLDGDIELLVIRGKYMDEASHKIKKYSIKA